jgi:hypothetical protein
MPHHLMAHHLSTGTASGIYPKNNPSARPADLPAFPIPALAEETRRAVLEKIQGRLSDTARATLGSPASAIWA